MQGKALFVEAHAPLRLGQRRRVGAEADGVARQGDFAAGFGFFNVLDGQVQRERQTRLAVGFSLVQRVLREACHGRSAHDAQRGGQIALALGLDLHDGAGHVVNAGGNLVKAPAGVALHVGAGVFHAHAVAFKNELARQVFQRRPGGLAFGLEAAGHVGHEHVFHAARKAELAVLAGFVKRDMAQVALNGHVHILRQPFAHGVAHVVARFWRNDQRQVAVHARAVGAGKAPFQVEHAGKARLARRFVAGVPADGKAAGGVGAVHVNAVGLHADAAALHLPVRLCFELAQGNARLFKHAGESEAATGDEHFGRAALGAGVHIQRGAVQPRRAGSGIGPDGQGAGAELEAPVGNGGGVCRGGFGGRRVAPGGVQAVHLALDGARAQVLVRRFAQGQSGGQAGQGGQIELVGAQLAAGFFQLQAEIAAGPDRAAGVFKLQVFRAQGDAAAGPLPVRAARQRAQGQRRQARRQHGGNAGQRHIQRGLGLPPFAHAGPGAQRAPAFAQFHAQIARMGIAAQLRHVHAREIGIGLPAPLPPLPGVHGQQRLAEIPYQREALAPLLLRRGLQLHDVAAAAIAKQQAHVGQGDGRRGARFVHPAHLAALQQQLRLREKPVGKPRVGAGVARSIQPGHQQAAIGAAAQLHLGAVYHQLLKAQAPERAHGKSGQHARHFQPGFAVCAIRAVFAIRRVRAHRHAVQGDDGNQPVGDRLDAPGRHLCPHRARGQALQPWAQIVDTRHNEPVQKAPRHR